MAFLGLIAQFAFAQNLLGIFSSKPYAEVGRVGSAWFELQLIDYDLYTVKVIGCTSQEGPWTPVADDVILEASQ